MNIKSLTVIALCILGCSFASAQTFGFASVGGGLYCNYEQLAPAGNGGWGGIDNLSACGASVNSTLSGFNATLPSLGLPVGGTGVVVGDSIYAAFSGNPFAQWTVFTKLKCNKQNRFGQYTGSYGWMGAAAFSGFYVGGNQGFLSCSIPGKAGASPTKGTSVRSRN
ncbi:MAG: hypothetical protein WAK23_19210 [Terriglobales bacterium]